MMSTRKQQIIEVTCQLLANEGLKAVTMRRVADEIGLSAPALYRHFKDRDAIIHAVVEQQSALFGTYLFRALKASEPEVQLVRTGELYLQFAFDHEVGFGLLFGAWHELSVERHGGQADERGISPNLQFLMDRVAACAPVCFGREVLMELAMELWAVVHGLASLYLYGGGRQQMTRQQYEAMCTRIIRKTAHRLTDMEPE